MGVNSLSAIGLSCKLLVGLGHSLDVEFEAKCFATGQDPDLWLLLRLLVRRLLIERVLFFKTTVDVGCNRIPSLLAQATSIFARPPGSTRKLASVTTLVSRCLNHLLDRDEGVVSRVSIFIAAWLLTERLIGDYLVVLAVESRSVFGSLSIGNLRRKKF
mgnify:FL=1